MAITTRAIFAARSNPGPGRLTGHNQGEQEPALAVGHALGSAPLARRSTERSSDGR
jgi:hypothetical protein